MSKFRVDSPVNTPLDPQAFEKQFVKPNLNNPSPFSGVTDQLQFVAPDKVDEGYGTMGNSGYAVQAINEAKAANQGFWELTAKGLGNVAGTIVTEVGKTPGYIGGLAGAGANEVFGDGKNSMSMIVDNSWVNAFERLDESIKDTIPVYISQQVQDGKLLDKLGSGEWWATTGADGLGFMLSMFVPGAAAKALGVGSKIARIGEGLGKLSPRIGKAMTGAGLLEEAGEVGFAYTKAFAKNADGYASALLNTTIESSAEAANTFDNVKNKYIQEGLSEEEASLKAGDAAASVFKGNMALLAVSNYLDERWIWKTIGSVGQKEAAQSMLNNIFKDGVVNMDALKNISKEFTRNKVLKRAALNFGKGVLKEGFYEEGSQTILQQNIEGGKDKNSILGNLSDVVSSYLNDFSNNVELQESIFLGGLLGGGASIVGTVQENNALRNTISGGSARTKDNSIWSKYGILPETKAQKGIANILQENHIKQFRSYKDLLDEDGRGGFTLNEQKLVDANLEQSDIVRANILYDLSVAQGNKLGQEIFGQYLAANYVNGFLGQEGSKELFQDHAKQQVLPAWQKRFLETFGRDATSQESSNYLQNFTESGNRVIDSYNSAEETNYPERYYQEPTKEYQDFKKEYFHNKFHTLVTLDSVKARNAAIMSDMMDAQVTELDLEELDKIQDPIKKIKAQEIKNDLKELKEVEDNLSQQYTKFFTKEGVKEMFNQFKTRREKFQQIEQEVKQENAELREQVNTIPERNQAEIDELRLEVPVGNARFKAKDGRTFNINDLSSYTGDIQELDLKFDDVSNEEWDSFVDTGKASGSILKKISDRMVDNPPLSEREQAIATANGAEIEGLLKERLQKAEEQIAQQEPQSIKSEDASDYNEVDTEIENVYKKKGVNLYPSTGRNLLSEVTEVKPGVFAEKLTPKPSQQLWFKVLDEEVKSSPTAYTVQVVRLDDESNPELHKQIVRDSDPGTSNPGDLYTVLQKDGKPIIKDGNYVFSGLWRPSTLYPVKNGKPTKFILAEDKILENFLLHVRIPDLDITNISQNQKDYLGKYRVTDFTEQGIMTAAFFHSKNEYTEWYEELQNNPGQLQVQGVTKGHTVKLYSEAAKNNPIWGKPLIGIPGLNLVDDKLIGGKFEMSISGTIQIEDELFKIPAGDVVIVDNSNNVHPMRSRNLNEDEVKTVLYLLSLRTQLGPTESIKLKAPESIRFGNVNLKEIPVFFNKTKGKSRVNLIESLISFGSKNGGKGEIYFSKQSLGSTPLLVWTDFDGNTQNLDVNLIKEAVDTNNLSKIQNLVDFLNQKRFNVNEHLLLNNNTFSKPQLTYKRDESGKQVPELEWDQTRSYHDHLLNDTLSTTTQQLEGYPSRVQRNLWFSKQPIEDLSEFQNIFEETGVMRSGEEGSIQKISENLENIPGFGTPRSTKEKVMDKIRNRKSLDSFKDDMDKILTTSDLLKAKIKSGEIIQQCK